MINAYSNLGSTLPGLKGLFKPLQGQNTNQLAPQVRDHADRDTAFTRFNSPKAATLLNDRMASSVGSALGANGSQSPAGLGEDFSPEKVANNILSFINSAIGSARNNGADPATLAKKMADAKAGVEKGFAEARDILQSFGAWGSSVKDNAEKTLGLIRKGFDDGAAAQQAVPAPLTSGGRTANLAAVDTRRAQTFEMEIKTREGDIVKLSYSTNSSAGFTASRVVSDSGVKQEVSAYSSKSQNLSFSVQGNLNDDEQKAIDNLMKDVDKLAQDFYGGDMQGAMQHAMALDMNHQQLSSLSLDLSYTQSRSAVSAYQQVGAIGQGKSGPAPLNSGEVGTVGGFNKSLEKMLQEAGKFFQNAENMAKKLFSDIAPDSTSAMPEDLKKVALSDLLNGLIAAAANRKETAQPSQKSETISAPTV